MPPLAANGRADEERGEGGDPENERRGLPPVRPSRLLDGGPLLLVQSLPFVGKLLFHLLPTFFFGGNVTEQGTGSWGSDKEHRGHAHDAGESFHI